VSAPIKLLVVDDSDDDATLLVWQLRRGGYEIDHRRVDTAAELRAAIEAATWDVILCDYSMPSFEAPEAFQIVRERGLDVPFIIVSGVVGEEVAVECMRAGVHDFVLKGNLSRLVGSVQREVADAAVRAEQARMREKMRRFEEVLARSEKLRVVGQMAAGISHDLGNLMNPLSLHLQLLERALSRGDVAEARESAAEMKGVLRRGLQTLERLRSFSRQAPGAKARPVDLDRIVEEAVEVARSRLASGRGPRPEIVVERGDPPAITAHADEVVAAVVNLVVNAIDAMTEGGTIKVRTGAEDGSAWIQVADDGPGMSPEVQARVFEPFFSTKGEEGTGLGLAMVFACVTRHGGTVSLDTAPGKGATFTLHFPVKDVTAGHAH